LNNHFKRFLFRVGNNTRMPTSKNDQEEMTAPIPGHEVILAITNQSNPDVVLSPPPGLASPTKPSSLGDLGADLGRRLARLELGGKQTKEKLEKLEHRNEVVEEAITLEDAKIVDFDSKVISVETRLSSVERQGLKSEAKLAILERKFRSKEDECSQLKVKLEEHEKTVSKLGNENKTITAQFVTLLKTCESFQADLESLKKNNSELKNEIAQIKKQEKSIKFSEQNPLKPAGNTAAESTTSYRQSSAILVPKPATTPGNSKMVSPPTSMYSKTQTSRSLVGTWKTKSPPTIVHKQNWTSSDLNQAGERIFAPPQQGSTVFYGGYQPPGAGLWVPPVPSYQQYYPVQADGVAYSSEITTGYHVNVAQNTNTFSFNPIQQ